MVPLIIGEHWAILLILERVAARAVARDLYDFC